MSSEADRAIAIVGVGAILPDAMSAPAFWRNICDKRYSIGEVPADRWSVADYYDPDPNAPYKTYSKIGSWIQGFEFDWKRFRIPPRVAGEMDQGQQWAVTIAAEALDDYGYPNRPLDTERTGVILGTAMGGEKHYETTIGISFPEYAHALEEVDEFSQLSAAQRNAILASWEEKVHGKYPPITEDTMPGELPNIVSGRVANVLNLRGPNFITDAACASSFAAINAAFEMLTEHHVDAVLAGGVDRNMGAAMFVKFCKIGALSATGSRPFGEGADGFVMGEGSGSFLLKRLVDAERDGDKIYAVIRGVGGSSDGKGKGITAPNPKGQILAIERAWRNAGLDPATATLVEAHGTSTKVGDVVEAESLVKVFGGAPRGSIALGSAKSNIGHLKAGSGAAGLLKATFALHNKQLPPTLNAERANPNFDFAQSPFFLSHELQDWDKRNGAPRRAGVSAYGFGGTNFHLVLEEHIPGMLTSTKKQYSGVSVDNGQAAPASPITSSSSSPGGAATLSAHVVKPPIRGILAVGADRPSELKDRMDEIFHRVHGGWTPPRVAPSPADLSARERLVIDFGDHDELEAKVAKARKAVGFDNPAAWKALQAQGIFRGSGPKPGKIGFLFPGQGSQYPNMGRQLAAIEPVVKQVFDDADAVMTPILGQPLTDTIFVDANDPDAMKQAGMALMQTAITQPAMLTMDIAVYKLLGEYGVQPDMVMGHSLGEYGALIAAGVMPFAHALEASAARGAEMTKVSMDDNGWMAAVFAPYDVVEQTLDEVDGYVVAANINSYSQAVIGGASNAVEEAIRIFGSKGFRAIRIPVSHAFHTRIVAPASAPLRTVLDRLSISSPQLPLVANVTGELYPTTVEEIKDSLVLQIASPVQWVKGLETMYANGVRTFVEVGPKKALKGFVDDVLGKHDDVWSLFTNHPKMGELPTFNQALCGLYAAGYGAAPFDQAQGKPPVKSTLRATVELSDSTQDKLRSTDYALRSEEPSTMPSNGQISSDMLGQALAQALQQLGAPASQASRPQPYDRNEEPAGSVVITGTGLGLPGADKPLMDPDNALRILNGEQFIDLIPERFRKQMAAKRITRLVKGEDGSGRFVTITDPDEVIKLAGRPGSFDLTEEYGVSAKLVEALDITTQMAIAAGLDALREAGIPLVQTYRKTRKGTYLPEKWLLPEPLRDETGIIFASAFPGGDRFTEEMANYFQWENRNQQLETLEDLRAYVSDDATRFEINRRITALREEMDRDPYIFDRRFLFRILAMGHSQFAEYIGARGPNTQVNAACASTAQGVAIAEDWIRSGRCRRVIVIGADAVTGENLMGWVGAGFLATGAAATDDRVEEAALPFDRRRHGTILGMGACALVVESEDAARERGIRGIVELLSSETANSAFHGTRLDVNHISDVMQRLVTASERRFGLSRFSMAPRTVFVSHETFTPARGGSAAAEVTALRNTFGDATNDIIMANTKGFTGHPMGVGVEDVIAIKILEYGIVPPVPNFKEVDPELGLLNLSRGGRYPVQYALHLAAGFGSQISLTLMRRIPGGLNRTDNPAHYRRWLADVSGLDSAQTEVVKRVLRIRANGDPGRTPVANTWRHGVGPAVRITMSGGAEGAAHPARMIAPSIVERGTRSAEHGAESAEVAPPAPEPKPASAPQTVVAPAPEAVARGELQGFDVSSAERASAASVTPQPQHPTTPVVDEVTAKVLTIVADKTGYPEDMLDLDLDMEADLGIDTVKQAETFTAIREAFDIPAREDLSLRDYPTLEAVVGFVHEMRPDLASGELQGFDVSSAERANGEVATATPPPEDEVTAKVLAIVADKTGYPEDMLDLDLDMEADLGIDTVKQAETFGAVREVFDIPMREDLSLRDYPTLEAVVGFVHEMRPDLASGKGQGFDVSSAERASGEVAAVTPPPQDPTTPPPEADVAAKVLAIVAEKTGYPEDMLELDLDMEADLGIDTVKQAETFAAIRELFDIPLREDLSLRDYPTLESVIGFVHEMRPDLASGKGQVASSEAIPHSALPAPHSEDVAAKVLAIVAEKTGYPEDMLELDLDMEADLGIDTVKQAETFAAIRELFDIPLREDLSLRDYPTLESVIGFVFEMKPELASGEGRGFDVSSAERASGKVASVAAAAVTPSPHHPTTPTPIGTLEDADKMPRRVPTPMLRPALDLCKPTGITLDAQSWVVVMLDQGGVGKSLVNRLEKRGVTALTLEPGIETDALDAQLKVWLEDGKIQGVYWLAALDIEPGLEEMDLAGWREQNRRRAKNLYTAMRALYDSVAGPGAFLVAATRLGGLHGYGAIAATAPLGGAVSGFAKAYNVEQGMRAEGAGLLVKVVDFEVSRKTAEPADLLIAETLADAGVVEVGYHDSQRFVITLIEQPAADGQPGMALDENTVFVVTGAAGGITSAIVTDLAVASKGVFYLLDLVEAPPRDDANIALFRSDKEALKRKLIDDARARGERPTPVVIEKEIMVIERSEAALRAIETVEAAGGVANYRSVNLMDGQAVTAIVTEIRAAYGRIDVLLHAGGLLFDRTLPDKEPQQFALVFDVKADGFFNLVNAAREMPIGATVAFSSVAGRFGNNGQSDYSSANDLLCKISSSMRSWRPETRAIAIDWTAWGEIGMAARGSVPTVMAALGIDMLPPESGVPTIRRELTCGGTRGEVLVAGRLGAWTEEDDPSGGLDTRKANTALAARERPLAMIGEIKAARLYGGIIAETTLDPSDQPFLYDHQVEDGVPWLPGVMGTEALAEMAALIAPGYRVAGVENQEILGALKFHRNEAKTLRLSMVITLDGNGDLLAAGRLQSLFQPAKAGLPVQIKDHFVATVRLSKHDAADAPVVDFTPPAAAEMPIDAAEVYDLFFHGPAYQVIERAVVDGDRAVALMADDLGPNASPANAASLTAPRTLEHLVQSAALWSVKTNGAMALPAGFDAVTYHRDPAEATGRLYANLTAINDDESYDAQLVDESGVVYVELSGYRTVSMIG